MAGTASLTQENDRPLRLALLASLVLHAAALAGLPVFIDPVVSAPDAPAIQSRLVEAAREIAPASSEPHRKPAPAPKPVAKPAAKEPAPPAAITPSPVVAPATPAAEVTQAAPTPAPEPQPLTSAASSQATAATSAAPDTRSLGEYRLQVIAAARRDKERNKERYMRVARETNWTGRVLVGVAVDSAGEAQIAARRSSGHPALDQQAVEMFTQAVRAVSVPPSLRGKPFSFEVTAVFALED